MAWALAQAKAPTLRSIVDWVEDEIVIPNGPFADERYRHDRHPCSRLWFAAIDSGRWSRFAATGPTQNGKTLMCYVLPVLYHLFEVKETVIVGLPDMNMANDKWREDFLPVIQASRFREFLPSTGEGSKGGQVKRGITFRHGATLRFMTAGGGDKKRAAYTSRVLAVTETDGMDEPGEASREADKVEQLEARTRAFGTSNRIYLECTVSIEEGRIWQEVHNGTDSRIVRPCPHCSAWVTPEREHLKGWQSALSAGEAGDLAYWSCPACDQRWTADDVRDAAKSAVLVHRGQEVTPDGQIVGEAPRTNTLGFRWSAIDNPFETTKRLGAEEWAAMHSRDRENAERKMRQFVWTLPYEPPEIALIPIDAEEVQNRTTKLKRGELPENCLGVVVGIDTGKRKLHWDAKAVTDGEWPIIDYGIQPVESDAIGVQRALLVALHQLAKYFESGWSGAKPAQVWIDSGWHEHTDAVYQFCAEMNGGCKPGAERYRPSKGYGEGQRRMGRYFARIDADTVYAGKEFYISLLRRHRRIMPGIQIVHVNSDHWKSEFHQRLVMPADEAGKYPAGAITFFEAASAFEHSEWVNGITAEQQIEKMINGRPVVCWELKRNRRDNHPLDAGYLSTCAAQFVLDMSKQEPVAPKRRGVVAAGMTRPDGRPWL